MSTSWMTFASTSVWKVYPFLTSALRAASRFTRSPLAHVRSPGRSLATGWRFRSSSSFVPPPVVA